MKKHIFLLLNILFLAGCAGAHYQAHPSAPKMEKGQQRIAVNISVSLGKERKLKWFIPKDWLISNWAYSLEYRYGFGNDMDIGIYPAGFYIIPCAVDIRKADIVKDNRVNFHRLEFFYNPETFDRQISNNGIRYDYFSKTKNTDEITDIKGVSLLLLRFWDIDDSSKQWYHPIAGIFAGKESENVLYEFDYLPGFNYFMEKPDSRNPILNLSSEKQNIPRFLTGDLFFGISHGNSFTE